MRNDTIQLPIDIVIAVEYVYKDVILSATIHNTLGQVVAVESHKIIVPINIPATCMLNSVNPSIGGT